MVQHMCVRVFMCRKIAACALTSVMRHACSVCNAQRNYDIAAAIPNVNNPAHRTPNTNLPLANVACRLFLPESASFPTTALYMFALSSGSFLVLAWQPHVVGFSRAPLHFYYFSIFSVRISTIYICYTRCCCCFFVASVVLF